MRDMEQGGYKREAEKMSPDFVVTFAKQSIELTLLISLPMLGIGLAVGLVVSIFQAATQIQEQTLAFIPKIVSMFLALLIAFPWIMDQMVSFTRNLFMNIPVYIR
jgi:flagellar biosynthetic protein FliQ